MMSRITDGLKQIEKTQKIIANMLDSPILKQIETAQEALNNIIPPEVLSTIENHEKFLAYQKNAITGELLKYSTSTIGKELSAVINQANKLKFDESQFSLLNQTLQQMNALDCIPTLRTSIPLSFSYEHNDHAFYDKEIYPKLFDKKDDWCAKIEKNTFSILYRSKNYEIDGDVTREFLAVRQLFPEIEENKIIGFISYLKKFPFMALSDKEGIGQKLFYALKEKAMEYSESISAGSLLYRARELNKKIDAYYLDEEMLEPYTGIPDIGRFNPYGVSMLYVSESPETSKKELGKKKLQIAEIKTTRPLHILDLKKNGGILYRYCSNAHKSKDYNPVEYMLSNFLGQCGSYLKMYEHIELDGFKYESTKDAGKYCYVLFEVHKPDIEISNISHDRIG